MGFSFLSDKIGLFMVFWVVGRIECDAFIVMSLVLKYIVGILLIVYFLLN